MDDKPYTKAVTFVLGVIYAVLFLFSMFRYNRITHI